MDGIYSFDIHSGSLEKILAFDINGNTTTVLVGVCDGRWVVANVMWKGIYVYDLKNECSVNHCWEEIYDSMLQCSENPSVFYALPRQSCEAAQVLEVSGNGRLSHISSFPNMDNGDYRLVPSFQQRCFFSHDATSAVHVVNSSNDKIENKLGFPDHDVVSILPNGTEMFVGLETRNGLRPRRTTTITFAAFLSDNLM